MSATDSDYWSKRAEREAVAAAAAADAGVAAIHAELSRLYVVRSVRGLTDAPGSDAATPS